MRTTIRLCVLAALLALLPSVALAESILGRSSGPFRVQIGTDDLGNREYADCGELNLYKTDTGREWRLDETCQELVEVLSPPQSTVTPAPPTPKPPLNPPPPSDCPDGFLSKINSGQWGLSNVILTEGKDHVWCVDLPQSTRFFFEVKTVNKGNTSCSDLEMTAISPLGVEYFSNGSQPGVPPRSSPGRWRIKLHLNEGCSRYDVNIVF